MAAFDLVLSLKYACYLITLDAVTGHPHAAALRDWLPQEARREDESGNGG